MHKILIVVICFTSLLPKSWPQELPPEDLNSKRGESTEIRRKFAELSKKVNEQPELKKLKTDLQKAQEAYTAALGQAIAKEDAGLLAKYKAIQEESMARMREGTPASKPASGYDQLTEEEKKQLQSARKQAMEVPAVKEARQKRNAAQNEADRKAAEAEYKTALRESMLKTDEKLEPLLYKLEGKAQSSPTPAAKK